MPNSGGSEVDSPGALERGLDILASGRRRVRDGNFGGLLLIAFAIVVCQIIGVSKLNTTVALPIVEASSVSNLLFVIPGLTLLPLAGYVASVTLSCYVLGKLDLPLKRRGLAVILGFGLLTITAPALVLFLPAYAAVVYVTGMGFFVFELLRSTYLREKSLRRNGLAYSKVEQLSMFPEVRSSQVDRSYWPYVERLAVTSRRVTDLWSSDARQLRVIRDPIERRTVGALALLLAAILGLAVVWPHPWLPARVIQINSPNEHAIRAEGCAIVSHGARRSLLLEGYVIGTASDRLTILAFDRNCVVSVDPTTVVSQTICRPSSEFGAWFLSTWGLLTGSRGNVPSCPNSS